jgi:DNA polymerase-3 subunit delta'
MVRALELAEEEAAVDSRQLTERVAALSQEDVPSLFSLSEELGSDREKALAALEQLLAAARNDLLRQQGCPDLVAGHRDDDTHPLPPAGATSRIEWIMGAMKALRRNANVRLTLDVLLMRLADSNSSHTHHLPEVPCE